MSAKVGGNSKHRSVVAVCIVTFGRPDGLRRLLTGLNDLTFRGDPAPEIRIVVVDNDPQRVGAAVCQDLAQTLRWPIKIVAEPRRGIPYARNTALRNVDGDVDYIAFIDDDEVPDPEWLDELLRVQRQYDADVVAGVVLPYFTSEVPSWIVKGGFFDRRRYPTGTRRPYAATNNVIARSRVIKDIGPTFSERMALTGGSDTHYFKRVARAGYSIVWADSAVVYEWIPASRANVRWLLQRAFRKGNCLSVCDRELGEAWPRRTLRFCEGLGRIIYGLISFGLCVVPDGALIRIRALKSLSQIWRGVGTLAGFLGYGYEEYRHIHRV